MRKFISVFVVLLTISISGFAQGGFTGPGRYRIEVVATGKALDLRQEDNKTVQLWSSGGSRNQQWDIQDAGDGYFYIESVANNLVLGIGDSRVRDGSRVITDRLDRNDGNQKWQKWKIVEARGGNYTIISISGKSLESPAGNREDGAGLQVSRPLGRDNQRFMLIRLGDLPVVSGAVAGDAGSVFAGPGRYQIQIVSSGKNLDLRKEDGVTVQQWAGADVLNQKWDIEDSGDGYFYIRSSESGRVIEVADSRDGASLRVNNFTGRDNQKWRIADAGNGQFTIGSKLGRVMALATSNLEDGAPIQASRDRRQSTQLFRLMRVEVDAAQAQTIDRSRRGGRRRADTVFTRPQDPYTPGSVKWRGRVDIEVLLEIQGSTVTEKLVGGRSFNNGQYDFTATMPAREMDVRINKIRVRGTVELVEKPSPSNNYTAIVRIRDPQRDAADYEFELIW